MHTSAEPAYRNRGRYDSSLQIRSEGIWDGAENPAYCLSKIKEIMEKASFAQGVKPFLPLIKCVIRTDLLALRI